MDGGLDMTWFGAGSGGGTEVGLVTGKTALARLLLLGEPLGPALFARLSFSDASAALRPLRVKGRFAGPISCECVETSTSRSIRDDMRDNVSHTTRANLLGFVVCLVADRCGTPDAIQLRTL